VPSRAPRDSARWCGRLYEAADHRRVAQCLRAVRWPGLELFQRSELKAGPLHVPTTLRASAQRRSGLATHFVALLWRAPLPQSARGRALIEKRGASTLHVQTPHGHLRVIGAALEHAYPSRLHNGGLLRSHQMRHASRHTGHEAQRSTPLAQRPRAVLTVSVAARRVFTSAGVLRQCQHRLLAITVPVWPRPLAPFGGLSLRSPFGPLLQGER